MRTKRFALKLITAPASEPLTTAEAKARLRVTVSDEDTDIGNLISEARAACENECGRAFVTQTWSLYLDEFPGGDGSIRVPRPPLQSVTWIKYYDADGVQQTLDSSTYLVTTGAEPARVTPVPGQWWPATQSGRPEAVEVRFVAGYGLAAAVPYEAKAAMYLVIADRHEMPTGGQVAIPPAARRLLDMLETGEIR